MAREDAHRERAEEQRAAEDARAEAEAERKQEAAEEQAADSGSAPVSADVESYAARLREIQHDLEEIHDEIGRTATYPFADAFEAACKVSDMAEYLEDEAASAA